MDSLLDQLLPFPILVEFLPFLFYIRLLSFCESQLTTFINFVIGFSITELAG